MMTDLIGQTIGQYQIVELIHQGENTVYKGFQASTNRYVAVKILNPSLATNPNFVQQFQQDMQRITNLQHSNILPIYDYGQQGELLYIVSPYVETGTLQTRMPPAFSLQQAQAILNPVAEALDYAYRMGVGCGNVKPSNILIDAQGQPMLTDLGYVQGIDAGGQDNVYLSPEQFQGAVADARSDVYALGILLYHMLVGQLPQPNTVADVRARRPDLPEEIGNVVLKATAPAPEQRFQSPGQLKDAFSYALMPSSPPVAQVVPQSPPPAAAPQSSPPVPAAKSKGGVPGWIFLLIGGLLICCCLSGGLGIFALGGDGGAAAPPPGEEAPPPDTEQPAPPPTADGSLLQGLFDMVASIFDSFANIIDSILGSSTPPPESPGEQPPVEQPPEVPDEQPPPEESGDPPAGQEE